MTATVIDIRDARDLLDPLPEIIVRERTVTWGTDTYLVQHSVSTRGIGAWFKIVDERGVTIFCRTGNDDVAIVDTAITAYRAGVARGRQQMQHAMEVKS
jgi:hypothetical protein